MSIYGISAEFTESIRFVTTVTQSTYFRTGKDRNGRKQIPKGHSANSVNQADSRNWPLCIVV